MRASQTLSRTLPYSIVFTLHQNPDPNDNPEKKPVLVQWSPYQALILHKFKLFHHWKEGLNPLSIEDRPSPSEEGDKEVSTDPHDFLSIPADGNLRINAGLPIEYYTHLRVGEKYSLLWPGDQIQLWSFTVSTDAR